MCAFYRFLIGKASDFDIDFNIYFDADFGVDSMRI